MSHAGTIKQFVIEEFLPDITPRSWRTTTICSRTGSSTASVC